MEKVVLRYGRDSSGTAHASSVLDSSHLRGHDARAIPASRGLNVEQLNFLTFYKKRGSVTKPILKKDPFYFKIYNMKHLQYFPFA